MASRAPNATETSSEEEDGGIQDRQTEGKMTGRLRQRLQRLCHEPQATEHLGPAEAGETRKPRPPPQPLPGSQACRHPDLRLRAPRTGKTQPCVVVCYGSRGNTNIPASQGCWARWAGPEPGAPGGSLGKWWSQVAGVACVQTPVPTWPSASRGSCPLPWPMGWIWEASGGPTSNDKCPVGAACRRGTGREGEAV